MSQSQVIARSQTPFQAFAVLAAGVLAVSVGSTFIRLAQEESVPSLLIAAARLGLASLVLTPFVLWRYSPQIARLKRNDLLLAGLSGIFLAIHFATWVSSLEYTSVLISVVLVSTNPLWVGIMEVMFLRARLNWNIRIGLAVAFLGGLLIAIGGNSQSGRESNPLLGAGLALAGALAFSVYFVIGRKLRADLPVIPYIWLVYSCGAIPLLVGVTVSRIPLNEYSAEGFLWLAATALVPQLIGHSSLNYALGFVPATLVTLAMQLEPALSGVIAFFVFNERPGLPHIIGSATILLGIITASLGHSRSE